MAVTTTISTIMSEAQQILVPVSAGELVDKITILEIKQQKLQQPEALKNVKKELALLEEVFNNSADNFPASTTNKIVDIKRILETINQKLWDVEDALREHEKEENFGSKFIKLARSVYKLNDERAKMKRSINILCGSELIEEKSYS